MNEPTMHFLETWEEYFDPMADGRKRFIVTRKNDRKWKFNVGDVLILAKCEGFTGRLLPGFICAPITYILEGMGLKPGYCVLGFQNSVPATQKMKDFYLFKMSTILQV